MENINKTQFNTKYAIVDCNNFFVSCERVFQPKLNNIPVIVLSNNDGCAIARSNEAKKLGIKGEIINSTPKNKKYTIIRPDGKKISFGQIGYEDFIDHKDEQRKKNFHNRFRSNKGYNNLDSPLYYSQKLLW